MAREIIYNRIVDSTIEGIACVADFAKANEKREDISSTLKYHSARAVLSLIFAPYFGLCKLIKIPFSD